MERGFFGNHPTTFQGLDSSGRGLSHARVCGFAQPPNHSRLNHFPSVRVEFVRAAVPVLTIPQATALACRSRFGIRRGSILGWMQISSAA
jgi:hypothetical protein